MLGIADILRSTSLAAHTATLTTKLSQLHCLSQLRNDRSRWRLQGFQVNLAVGQRNSLFSGDRSTGTECPGIPCLSTSTYLGSHESTEEQTTNAVTIPLENSLWNCRKREVVFPAASSQCSRARRRSRLRRKFYFQQRGRLRARQHWVWLTSVQISEFGFSRCTPR